jgi:hypothetical protein
VSVMEFVQVDAVFKGGFQDGVVKVGAVKLGCSRRGASRGVVFFLVFIL